MTRNRIDRMGRGMMRAGAGIVLVLLAVVALIIIAAIIASALGS